MNMSQKKGDIFYTRARALSEHNYPYYLSNYAKKIKEDEKIIS